MKEYLLIGSILFLLTAYGDILTTRPDNNAIGVMIGFGWNSINIYSTDRKLPDKFRHK